jgi:hypothetical protein
LLDTEKDFDLTDANQCQKEWSHSCREYILPYQFGLFHHPTLSIVAASETVGSHSPRHLWSCEASSYQTLIRVAKNAEGAVCCGFCEGTSVMS